LKTLPNTPFVKEAQEYVRRRGISLEDLGSDYFRPMIQRAKERIREAIKYGIVRTVLEDPDVEIISYPIAILILSQIGDPFLSARYAVAEAKRVNSLLREEEDSVLLYITQHTFQWKVFKVSTKVMGRTYAFAIYFRDYLRGVPRGEIAWKLINRPLIDGYVLLQKYELARLIEEALRKRIESLCSERPSSEMRLPTALEKAIEEVIELYRPYRERIGSLSELRAGGSISREAFPPCIKALLDDLERGKNLPHMARFTLATFLLNIGMSIDEVLDLFRRTPDFNESKARYQIEHVAGLRGSKIKYLPPSCSTLKTFGLCTSPDEFCSRVRHPLAYYAKKMRRGRK